MDPDNGVLGPKYYDIKNCWTLKPYYLGPLTLIGLGKDPASRQSRRRRRANSPGSTPRRRMRKAETLERMPCILTWRVRGPW